MSARGKGKTSEELLRVCDLMVFLSNKGEAGATLEEIRKEVYAEEEDLSADSLRRKFNRDCAAVKQIYNVLWSDDNGGAAFSDESGNDDESPAEASNQVWIARKRGSDGKSRYILRGSSFFTVPLRISVNEAYVLSSGIELCRHFIGNFDETAKQLSEKLKRSIPNNVMSVGEGLSRALALSMPVSRTEKGNSGVMQNTLRAINERKPLKLWGYRDMKDKTIKPRVIYPYLLFFKYHSWYVLAGSDDPNQKEPGPYRLSRIEHAEVLEDAPFVPSRQSAEDLQRGVALDFHPLNPDSEYRIKLKIYGHFASAVRDTEWFPGQKISPPQPDKSVLYEVTLKGLEAITLWIMRALDSIEVLEPAELRDEIDRRVGVYLGRKEDRAKYPLTGAGG